MAKELEGLDRDKLKAYWAVNVRLTTIIMVIWAFVTYVCSFFAPQLNKIVILGFPFGYYMGAQGSLVIFVILIFWYAKKMNAADKEFGVEEEE